MSYDVLKKGQQRGGVALVVFLLFAISVFAFRAVARPNSPSVGLSAWTDPDTTLARLERVLGVVLQRAPLANALASDETFMSTMTAKMSSDPTKPWAAVDNIADALTNEDSRRRLARRWADEPSLKHDSSSSSRRTLATDAKRPPTVRELVRTAAETRGADRSSKVKEIAEIYRRALDKVVHPWLESEAGPRRLEFLTAEQNLQLVEAASTTPPAKTRVIGRQHPQSPESAGAAQPSTPIKPQLWSPLYDRVTAFLTTGRVETALQAAVGEDLDPQFATERLAIAIHSDFAARWTWIITASLLLTLAVSAVVGAFLQFKASRPDQKWRPQDFVGFTAAIIVVGVLAARGLPALSPPFLSDAVRQLDVYPSLGVAIVVLNAAAGCAVAALFVTAWTSFLTDTKDDAHLARQLGAVRWVFHTATIVMVAGVFEIYAVTSWPSASMATVASKMIASGAQAAAVAAGIAVSTLLLLIYVPAARALTDVAKGRLADADATRKAKIEKILEETGFNESPTKQAMTFAQLLSPLLVAPLASLIGVVGS